MSNLFKTTLNEIKQNKDNLKNNKVNCLPFTWDRFRNYLPGIIRGVYYKITANSGVGKSQLAKYLFIYEPYKWIKENPDKGIKLKIFYFALEESKKEFMYTMISNKLHIDYGIEIDVLQLQSYFNDSKSKVLSEDIINKIEAMEQYFQELEECLQVIDSVNNPTGIYKIIRNHSSENGTHFYYNFKEDKKKENPITEEQYKTLNNNDNWAYSHYTPNDPNEYVINIVDNFNLLSPESGAETLHKAMTRMSADYGRKQITKHFNYIFVSIQQQESAKEKKQWTNSGEQIEDKMLPTLDGLGENKTTQRDALVVIGLFAPDRYRLPSYKVGNTIYNIVKLGDNFRVLSILKNRIGRPNVALPLIFNGAINTFYEAPPMIRPEEYDYFVQNKKFPPGKFNF